MAPAETDDPIVKAENELLGAAASIEAAARKLAELKPRERPRQADETLNFEEQILEAAKSITAAAGALVTAASAAQRELVAAGKVSSTANEEDRQWSQGLISAASQVATATDSLCEAANAAVQGNASEEQLVASAKAVANSTGQLLLACRVKADPKSKTQQGLQLAGAAVQRAVEVLATSAKAVFQVREDETEVNLSSIAGGFQDDELEIQELILRKERELEKARAKLYHIRSTRYRDEEDEDSDS